MKRILALCAGVAVAVMSPVRAATPVDFAPLSSLIEQTKAATGLPSGTAVVVVKDGKVIHEGYYGLADIGAGTPVTADTVFYIASATKPFFALNALHKQAAGELDMAMSLQQMFPQTRFDGLEAEAITVGVDNTALVWATAFSGVHDSASRRALVGATRRDPDAAHGTFRYTNLGYNLLSIWMDQHDGLPWQDQLQHTLFDPLGMRHTSTRISTAEAAGWPMATPYSLASAQPTTPLYLRKADDTMQAAGGMVATAPDLARFLIAQLPGEGNTALARQVITRSQRRQVALDASYLDFARDGYAWGWYTGPYKGHPLLHHFGGFAGFHAHLSFMPDQNIALVVLNNEDVLGAPLTNLIADHVYGLLLHEPGIASSSPASWRCRQRRPRCRRTWRASARRSSHAPGGGPCRATISWADSSIRCSAR
jgi:CubicO group peptidase (beta-lactamase class C family)